MNAKEARDGYTFVFSTNVTEEDKTRKEQLAKEMKVTTKKAKTKNNRGQIHPAKRVGNNNKHSGVKTWYGSSVLEGAEA